MLLQRHSGTFKGSVAWPGPARFGVTTPSERFCHHKTGSGQQRAFSVNLTSSKQVFGPACDTLNITGQVEKVSAAGQGSADMQPPDIDRATLKRLESYSGLFLSSIEVWRRSSSTGIPGWEVLKCWEVLK